VIGHEDAVKFLVANLPPVSLIRGPRSVGKRTLAHHVLDAHRVGAVDRRDIAKLGVDEARSVRDFVSTAPMGSLKGIVCRLDNASEPALNALLKVLEEPPSCTRFFLTSTGATLPTVESRAVLVRCGLLEQSQVAQILRSRGMGDGAADDAARLGDGTVQGSLAATVDENARASVLSVLKAVSDKDRERLELALHGWSDESHALLRIFATEARTSRWRVFAPTDSFGLAKDASLVKGLVLDLSRSARPRITARYALSRALSRTGDS
jgi:hypothetical protein